MGRVHALQTKALVDRDKDELAKDYQRLIEELKVRLARATSDRQSIKGESNEAARGLNDKQHYIREQQTTIERLRNELNRLRSMLAVRDRDLDDLRRAERAGDPNKARQLRNAESKLAELRRRILRKEDDISVRSEIL